jgi:allantoinase
MGFKSFMCPSGINDFPNVDAASISAALPFLKQAGVPFFVHAEVVSDILASSVWP